jgi:CheY-like chemotaxis protein
MRKCSLILRALVFFICLVVVGCQKQSDTKVEVAGAGQTDAPAAKNPAVAAYEEQNRAQLETALRRQRDARPVAAAKAKTTEFRRQLELNTSGAWSALVGKHMGTFLELRRLAGRSASKTERCTICDGRGRLDPCLLCNGTGKCPTCRGAGRFGAEICPTCLGSGKCFFCFGSGSMPCPFCDDGLVYANQPKPTFGIFESEPPSFSSSGDVASIQPQVKHQDATVANQVAETGDVETREKPKGGPSMLVILGIIIAGILVWRLIADRVGDFLCGRSDPWAADERAMAEKLAEEKSFEVFANSFRTGPGPAAPLASVGADRAEEPAYSTTTEPEVDPLQTFHSRALEDIGGLRKLFSRVARCGDEAEKRKIFDELASRGRAFRQMANLPDIKPLWQLSAALEALLNHLAVKPDRLSASCLRTAVSALDLLTDLCVPGIRPCLATDPPVRVLAVDDDVISRVAVSNALKKVFSAPELAADGPAALEVAAGKKFDMIFLDIEMPGMDGFELCARLRQMQENERTPIVFVTSHSDFNSRAQLPLAGAQDLIAKPFLSFEVALKALTFVLRGRLAEDRRLAEPAKNFPSRSVSEPRADAAERVSIQLASICLPSQASPMS